MLGIFSSAAWEVALNLSEMASLGRRGWYWRLHWALSRAYRGDGALRVMCREGNATGLSRDQLVYGETPALSMLAMLARAGVSGDDTFFDLGCGRGIALLSAALEWPLRATGIDAIPTFVERGNALAQRLGIGDRARVLQGDFLEADLSEGTIFYAASTTFPAEVLDAVAARIATRSTPPRRPLRFITLSQPLLPPWKLTGKGQYPMTWGWNTVYFHTLDAVEAPAPAPSET